MKSQTSSDSKSNDTKQANDILKLDNLVVTGQRASLATAQQIKRENTRIVDSVIADDINKLPDASVGEALQRITGVQITRDRGEAGTVTVRGLTQMETTLNGHEIFTAGNDRNLDFNDIPAAMIAGIDVYKTASADQIEGGLGGSINLRTRKPLDFDKPEAVLSGGLIHGSLDGKTDPNFSLLATDKWQTESGGEWGALVMLSKQTRPWREDQKSSGTPSLRNDIFSGQTVIASNGTSETTSIGTRQRSAANIMLQWRPSDAWDFYAEGNYADFLTRQDSYQVNVGSSSTFIPGSAVLFPGSNNLQSISWTNAAISTLGFARDTTDRVSQLDLGGAWHGKKLDLSSDISYSQSYNHLFFSGYVLGSKTATFTQNVGGTVPGTSVSGTNLLNPANYTFTSLPYRSWTYEGDLGAFKLDGKYWLDNNPLLESLQTGVRVARRRADNAKGLIIDDQTISVPASSKSGYLISNPYTDFFSGSSSIHHYLLGDISAARDAAALRHAFGVSAPFKATNPLGIWQIKEQTQAAYLMANIATQNIPLDGNVGIRVVRTLESVKGNQSVPSTNTIAPIDKRDNYLDALPSINLRYEFITDWYLRAAASKTITRPDFNQLSPSLSLVRNTINPAENIGVAGNPDLKPIRANNFDLALEHYINPQTSVYLTGFLKKVDGFLITKSKPEIYNGVSYQVSRPYNSNPADVKGLEIGYQQFYDFLPGWMSGLGLQANYTYVNSATPSADLGKDIPLANLSKNSFNVVGMYEKGHISARLAYNWRDKYLNYVFSNGANAFPVYTGAYGWLDASFSYRFNKQLTVKLQGSNLLNTVRRSYYGNNQRPNSVWMNGRQIGMTITVRM